MNNRLPTKHISLLTTIIVALQVTACAPQGNKTITIGMVFPDEVLKAAEDIAR